MALTYNPSTGEWLSPGETPANRVGGISVTPGVPNAPTTEQVIGAGPNAGLLPSQVQDYSGSSTLPEMSQRPGESLTDYQTRIYNTPFIFAGGQAANTYFNPNSNWGGVNIAAATPTPSMKLPAMNPGASNINGVNPYLSYADSTLTAEEQAQKDEEKARQAEAQAIAQRNAKEQPLLNLLTGAPTREQTITTASQQSGFNERMAEERAAFEQLKTAKDDYTNTVAQRDEQIAKINDKLGSVNVLNNMVNTVNNRFKPTLDRMSLDINTQAAVLAYKQDKVTEAQNFINQAVDAAVADKKDLYDQLTFIRNENPEIFSRLDKDIQNAYNQKQILAERDYNTSKDNAQFAITNATKYPYLGIKPDDTPDQVIEKMKGITTSETLGSADTGYFNVIKDSQGNIISKKQISGVGGGGGGTGNSNIMNFDEYLINALNDGQSPQAAAQLALAYANDLKVKISLSDLVKRATELKNQKTVTPPITTTTTTAPQINVPSYDAKTGQWGSVPIVNNPPSPISSTSFSGGTTPQTDLSKLDLGNVSTGIGDFFKGFSNL